MSSELQAELAALEVPCPRCETGQAPIAGQLCFACSGETYLDRLATQRAARPRAELLREVCVPVKHLGRGGQFEEPERWPRDTRCPDVDPALWDGAPWAVGFVGEVYGAGKTCMAVELLYRWLCRHLAAGQLYVRAEDVAGIAFDPDPDKMRWNGIRNAGILLVDDLARGYQGGGAAPVSSLFSYREENNLPTIYTTNASRPADLGGGDDSLVNRLTTGLFLKVDRRTRRGLALEGVALR